ncbi:response regulator [Candidatus Kapaibacterium sp.]
MKPKVLLVDDETEVLMGYQRNLFKLFNISISTNGQEALDTIKEEGPFAAILSDYNMPGMNGIELLAAVKEISPDTTRLLITGYADLNIAINSVNTGKVFRFLTKPISPDNLILALNAATEQYKLVVSEKEILDKTLKGSIKMLIDILSLGYPEVFAKSNQYRSLARKVAESLGMRNLWEVEIATLLSQIGVVVVPPEIINKMVNSEILDDEEKRIIKKIPSYSKDLLKNIPRLEQIAEAIEKQDCNASKSNVHSIDCENVPKISKIIRVVKDYYKHFSDNKLPMSEALKALYRDSMNYDSEVLNILIKILNSEGSAKGIKSVYIDKLTPGMILADDVENADNVILLRKGRELSDVHIMRLRMLHRRVTISEPLFVYDE